MNDFNGLGALMDMFDACDTPAAECDDVPAAAVKKQRAVCQRCGISAGTKTETSIYGHVRFIVCACCGSVIETVRVKK